MLKLNIINDDNFSATIVNLLSGMLPHENYDHKYFGEILGRVFTVVKLEEMHMEYYVLFSCLEQTHSLMMSIPDSPTHFTRDGLALALRTGIDSVIHKRELGIRDYLISQGMSDDLSNELVLNDAKQEIYSRTMELYDRAFELKLDGSESLATLPAFKKAFLANVSQEAMNTQREILDGAVRIGREVYSSVEGWMDYMSVVVSECDIRMTDEDDNVFHINDASKTAEMEKALSQMFDGIGEFNVPPLDLGTPMMRHVLDVVAGNEGVGKTTWMMHCVGQLLVNSIRDDKGKCISGKITENKIAIMCGESHKALVWSKIMSTYIYRTRGKFFSHLHISGKIEVSEENKKIINLAKMELEASGNILLIGTLKYKHVYREVKNIYETFNFDALFIDHSMALNGQGTDLEKATMLAIPLREFKKRYPVYIQVLSHFSALAKELAAKGKTINSAPTRGGGVLSNEADDIKILLTDENLKKQNLLAMEIYKRRNGAPITGQIYLQVLSNVSDFHYDKRLQKGFSESLSAAAALERVQQTLGEESDNSLYTNLNFSGDQDYDEEEDEDWEDPDTQD